MKLLLVRHGEIPSNVNKIYAGKSGEELTPKGLSQAAEVAGTLTSYSVHEIYSSPIHRACQTAGIISAKTGIPINIENAFREIELGPWEGLSESEVAQRYPDEWNIWQNRPAELKISGRETLKELLERVLAGIHNIAQIGRDQNIIVVTHVAIIRVLLLWHSKKSLNLYKTIMVPNAEIFEMHIEDFHVM